MNQICDVVIVGTGAAGLFCALSFPENVQIRMITKQKADESDSFLAQGGICMLRGEEDYSDYFENTMRAGHYENDKKAVDLMIRSSNSMIRELIRYGVRFECSGDGQLVFTKEGAHSQPRILFHEDITGKEITSTLLKRAKERPNIVIDEYTTMVDIIAEGSVCGGIVAVSREQGYKNRLRGRFDHENKRTTKRNHNDAAQCRGTDRGKGACFGISGEQTGDRAGYGCHPRFGA